MEGNIMDTVLKTSDEWSTLMNIEVMDPDGWDRRNLTASWNELISEEEFEARVMVSTIIRRS